ELPVVALIPRASSVDFTVLADTGRIVEELVDQAGGRRNLADGEPWLLEALERRSERLHMGDLARHQELQGVLGAGVAREINQAFVDDLGACLGGDIAPEIDVELAGDLQ